MSKGFFNPSNADVYDVLRIEVGATEILVNLDQNETDTNNKDRYPFSLQFTGTGWCGESYDISSKTVSAKEIFDLIINFNRAVKVNIENQNEGTILKMDKKIKTLKETITEQNGELKELREYKAAVEILINKK